MNEELIYKYSDWNEYSKDGLSKRYFWFSKPTSFNDPFDSNMDVLLSFSNSNDIFTGKNKTNVDETLYDLIKRNTDDFGILCLTKATKEGSIGDKGYNNLHFWAHYANSYKGISIGYNVKKIENYYSDKLFCKAPLTHVNYIERPVDIDTYDFIINKDEATITTEKINGIFGANIDNKKIDAFWEQILLFKDKRIWGLENEYRIILAGMALSNMKSMSLFSATDFEIIDANGKGYKLPYPEEDIIKEVTFGVKFDNQELEKAVNLIGDNNKNVRFYTSKLDFVNGDIIREEIK
jgi:hypothetical protein